MGLQRIMYNDFEALYIALTLYLEAHSICVYITQRIYIYCLYLAMND